MGILVELGLFLGFIAFGFWQLHDVKKAQAERKAGERAAQPPQSVADNLPTEVREP